MDVNSGRKYDSSGRRKRAEQTRTAILGAARNSFAEHGYAATTVPAVARAAGVSVETVYKSIGPKPALVRALWEAGLAGDGPVPAEQRSDELPASVGDAVDLIRGWAQLMTEVAPRTAPVLLLIRAAAATDPEMAELLAETDQQRRARMGRNARRLMRVGGTSPGLTHRRITDILWLYSSPEIYELLVLKSGWDVPRYSAFVADSMIAALVDQ